MAGHVQLIWVRRERKYFFKRGWTANSLICPSGKSARQVVPVFCHAAPPGLAFGPMTGSSGVSNLRPHPRATASPLSLEERALARVSKDGRESVRCAHPSRRLLRKLLRMRTVFFTGLSRVMTAVVNLRSADSTAARSPGTAAALRSARHAICGFEGFRSQSKEKNCVPKTPNAIERFAPLPSCCRHQIVKPK
jgi:hypothetical protein